MILFFVLPYIYSYFPNKLCQYDNKKPQEVRIKELLNDEKNYKTKVLFNSRFKFGYFDGVCLVSIQLCDKYFIKRNFIFRKSKSQDFQKIVKWMIGFKSNTNYNFRDLYFLEKERMKEINKLLNML